MDGRPDRILVVSVRIVADAARRGEVIASLRSLVEPTRVVVGCLGCRLYADLVDANGVCLESEWVSREALARHLRSGAYRVLLGTIELGACRPEVTLDTISRRGGLEALAAVRGGMAGSPDTAPGGAEGTWT